MSASHRMPSYKRKSKFFCNWKTSFTNIPFNTTAKDHDGFSAGSYKDLTRVAWLNEGMWTELFLENKDSLLRELDYFINSLSEYRDAIKNNDSEKLRNLLAYGKKCKEEIDGI